MNFRFPSLLAVAAVTALALPAHAVTVVQWDFEAYTAPTGTFNSTTAAASIGTGTATGVHAAPATFSTPAGNGSAKSFSVNTWAVGDYWQFSFSTLGYTGAVVTFDQTGSGTGPSNFSFSYSTDGTNYTLVSTYTVPLITWSSGTNNAGSTIPFNLSAITALNNQPTVFVRLTDVSTVSLGGGTVAPGGTDRVDNFSVAMTAAVPEPETYALMAAGLCALAFIARRRKV